MLLKVNNSAVTGRFVIPGSKSHTIRALFIASLADGISKITNPLISEDAMSAVCVCRALGADIQVEGDNFIVKGFGGNPNVPDDIINVGNSGTTLRFGIATAALCNGYSIFTGDDQIRSRPLGPLINALNNLGADVISTRNNGAAPVIIKGKVTGGKTVLDSVTSQYLSSLLINAPLFEKDTEINLTRLNEVPYVDMTLWWLDRNNIEYMNKDYKTFTIKGGQQYNPFNASIPGDFSSATFFAVLAAISGEEFTLENLDFTDSQGDKQVFSILEGMGAEVNVMEKMIKIKGKNLKGIEIDMNSIPDALPAMAVAGCYAEGETKLLNVPQARLKETDRISVMCKELKKMGADIREIDDGLIIRKSNLKGCNVNGHYDHRVVMALAVAGLNAEGETIIDTAEAINITFPEFVNMLKSRGGRMELI